MKKITNSSLRITLMLAVWILLTVCVLLLRGPVVSVSVNTLDQHVQTVVKTVNQGDLQTCGELLYGSPDLGPAPDKSTPQGMIWKAFTESLCIAVTDSFRIENDTACLDAEITCLDMNDFWSRFQTMDPDKSADYSPDAIQKLLTQTLTKQMPMTLSFARDRGEWRIVPTENFCKLLVCDVD